MITTDDMLQAYYDCRKRKRRTASAVVYEMSCRYLVTVEAQNTEIVYTLYKRPNNE